MKEKLKELEILLEVSLIDEPNVSSVINVALEQTKNMWSLLDECDKKHIFRVLKDIVREEEISAKLVLGNCKDLLGNISYTQKALG